MANKPHSFFFFFCSEFCHTLKWISHGFTCVPHPDPPSHLPLHPLPLGFSSAPGPSACLIHPTWAGKISGKWWSIQYNTIQNITLYKVKLLNRVWLFLTPWTVAHQDPPSMGFSRQEYWSGFAISFSRRSSWPRDWTSMSTFGWPPSTLTLGLTLNIKWWK